MGSIKPPGQGNMADFSSLRELLPLLIPIIIIQIALIVVALRDLMGRERLRGPKWMWILIIVFVNLLGPILYLVLAREDE
jgi:hypothetical protein